MDCISPVWVKKIFQHVPCGKCNFCLRSRALDWCFRLQQEQKVSNTSHFITLTYADEYLPFEYTTGEATLCPDDLQRFLKRLRKDNEQFKYRTSKPIRFYAVGEYGEMGSRPHYHALVFNAEVQAIDRLNKTWPVGRVDVGRVEPASIGYVSGYVFKRFEDYGNRIAPFARMSRRPGIGLNYLEKNKQWHKPENLPEFTQELNRFHIMDNGHTRRLPRYYKEKVFTSGDREAYSARLQVTRAEAYQREITRLKRFYDDPETAYLRRISSAHEKIMKNHLKTKTL